MDKKIIKNRLCAALLIFIFSISFSLAQELSPEQLPLNQDFIEITSSYSNSETLNPLPTKEKIISETLQKDTSNSQAYENTIAEYFYDHEGKRIKKIVYNVRRDGHNESTYYMNTRPADFIQVINTNGTIINETYIYLQDKLIAKYDTNGRKFFYHPDHLGSTSLVTNESGDVVEDLLYLPYGDVLSGTEISRFGYTGQENDLESGFMDYGARQYDARFSRFIQPDPVISDIYNPQNLNRYAYVLNNPYKYVDPDGRIILPVLVVVGVVWAIDVGVGLFHGGNEGKNFIQSYGVGVQEAGDHFGRAATTAEGAGEFAFNFVGGEVATKIIGKFSKAESIGKI